MIDKLIILKRLSLIKYLYQQGVDQSKKPESIAGFSLLSFHDSIEMFLRLMVENKGKKESASFMAHWSDYPDLTLVESIKRLNVLRVNFKHKGILPAKDEIEACRIYARDFFIDNTKTQFNLVFDDISLIDLVYNDEVKNLLLEAQRLLNEGDCKSSIVSVAIAFDELLRNFNSTKRTTRFEPLLPIDRIKSPFTSHFNSRYNSNLSRDNAFQSFVKEMDDFSKKTEKSIDIIRQQFIILGIGIDYIKYARFTLLTPQVYKFSTSDGYNVIHKDSVINDEEQCQFCIDFVVDSAILIQNIDHDLSSLKTMSSF